MEEKPLAMASVPIQKWGRLYEDAEALRNGTVFRELDMPFFAVEKLHLPGKTQEQTERDKMLARISEVGFVLDDLTLYLDTHEEDRDAMGLYREKAKEKAELMSRFTEQFYPLCRNSIAGCCGEQAVFCWQAGPTPWDGGCEHVVL